MLKESYQALIRLPDEAIRYIGCDPSQFRINVALKWIEDTEAETPVREVVKTCEVVNVDDFEAEWDQCRESRVCDFVKNRYPNGVKVIA